MTAASNSEARKRSAATTPTTAVETVTLADDLLPFVYTDAHGAQESMGALGDPLDPWPKRWVVIVLDDDDPRLSGKIGADGYLAAVPPSEHPTVDERSCPTCTGQVRETVGLVCQTCGTDYGLDERDRLAGVMHGDSYEGLDPLARAEVDAALAAPPAPHGDGSWVCGRCGEAPEIHASRSSRCIYDPVFKPVSAAPPTATTLVTEAMVERVAKALCVKADCTPGFWRSFVPEAETALDAALTEGANR